MNPKIKPEHLARAAVVYVRQSTLGQVEHHTESKRRQYSLVDTAAQLGFASVNTIDDDLGRSGSGLVERPGFQKLVGMVCSGSVGAVLCIEASRLSRNGRDWHHLIDLCALVGTVIIDPDGVYDPRLINDRLLFGPTSGFSSTAPDPPYCKLGRPLLLINPNNSALQISRCGPAASYSVTALDPAGIGLCAQQYF